MKLFGLNIEMNPKEGKRMTPAERLVTSKWSFTECKVYIALPVGMSMGDEHVEKLVQTIRDGFDPNSATMPLPTVKSVKQPLGAAEIQERFRERVKGTREQLLSRSLAQDKRFVELDDGELPRIIINLPRLKKIWNHQSTLSVVQPWITDVVQQEFKSYL